ncbi:Dimer Tnp hAT domain-containing protein [Aphis craccivora]|uniref:Dimer Tnp hAT domain-containing protein n=1 Tax=Aphis craccivora TaxID=307492 RepID=A0A6G0YP59_APHCR|nr:Dimer Tnp hAT domain-containing protein [Aphis craccivora]
MMKEERLNALAVFNIESEITKQLDYKDLTISHLEKNYNYCTYCIHFCRYFFFNVKYMLFNLNFNDSN